jgi:hypothetical protein
MHTKINRSTCQRWSETVDTYRKCSQYCRFSNPACLFRTTDLKQPEESDNSPIQKNNKLMFFHTSTHGFTKLYRRAKKSLQKGIKEEDGAPPTWYCSSALCIT